MHILHGTWIPDDIPAFVQSGAFYLWVETDTPSGAARRHGDMVHPRHLAKATLTAFLLEKLGLREPFPGTFVRILCTKYFLLPTTAGKPSPSFELLRYTDEEEPMEFDLVPWQVTCYRVPDIISILADIHFMALHDAEDFQLGADIVFWHHYAQVIRGMIAKDQYIPALKYQAISSTPMNSRREQEAASFELHPAWELLADTYEETLQRYAAAMPGVCAAGLNSPDGATLFEKAPLLRHFSECLLHQVITEKGQKALRF